MATTGYWPVKSRLKEVIDYAENPDKTIDKRYVDSDLYAALQYVSNDKKTDECMYVSGINCNVKRAYERMTATKKRFGKTGGNVAYHGYQSFQTGEVTPEEAHKIGLETARRMWGKEYEIVVTTHLNTDNLHNHFVVNSVSFKTGRKFENHFCAAKSLKRNQEFWRCSNYKDGRGTCQIHYIRDVVLEKIVFEAISGLSEFVKCHETVFLYMLAKKTNAMRQKEHKRLEQTVEQGTKRIAEIDRLIEKVFEQNASGILSDERFSKMLQSYEKDDAGGFRQSKDLAGSEAEGYGFKAAAPNAS